MTEQQITKGNDLLERQKSYRKKLSGLKSAIQDKEINIIELSNSANTMKLFLHDTKFATDLAILIEKYLEKTIKEIDIEIKLL